MFKYWFKSTLYMVAGIIRSFDYEWNVSNAKPVLGKFGDLVKDRIVSDEDIAVVCREIAAVPGVPRGLKGALALAAGAFDSPWVDFSWPFEKYRPIYDDLELWWQDNIFTAKEFASWMEKIADTIAE